MLPRVPEETLLGPFVLERELGRGGAGVVYAARHHGRRVALKISIDELPERDKEHFLQEAELLARVSHPAVIEILDSGTLDDGRPFLVMPLLEGETLGARIARGRLEPDLAVRLFTQLAGAVAALHDAGIVHRDIKPENVMYLEAEERLVLLDFGIARELTRPTSTTTRMNLVRGTPGCMAPERFFGVRASASSDVYELGVVLYAMLVGHLPWDDPTDPEARLRPRHPAELGIELPVGLGHLLLEALSTRPDRRPSIRDLTVRVRGIDTASFVPGAAPRATVALPAFAPMESPPPRALSIAPQPTSTRAREAPAILWTAVALGVTALAVGGSLWARSHRPAPPLYARSGFNADARTLEASLRVESSAEVIATAELPQPPVAEPTVEAVRAPAPGAVPARAPVTTAPVAPVGFAPPGPPPPPGAPPRPQGNEDLRNCKRVVAVYCSPQVKNSYGGEGMCAQAGNAWGSRLQAYPPDQRAAKDAECAQVLPAATAAMKQHVQTLGPGTAASARLSGASRPPGNP
jgi:eukaryotic-like serine/threonine-protein kinase